MDWRQRERRARRRKSGWQTSGGVVVDVASGRVLLVRSRREKKEGGRGWTWPKGLIDPGEGPVYAAIREIAEEAGVLAEPIAYVGSFETKRALRHYFLLAKIKDGMATDRETIEVRWARPERAAELLDRKRDRRVLDAAGALFDRQGRLFDHQGRKSATNASRWPLPASGPWPKSTLPSK